MESLALKSLHEILGNLDISQNRIYIQKLTKHRKFAKRRFCICVEIPKSLECINDTKMMAFPLTLEDILQIYNTHKLGRYWTRLRTYKPVPMGVAKNIACSIIRWTPAQKYCYCYSCMRMK